MTGRAFTRNPAGNPPAAQRAQALIAGFLAQHRWMVRAWAAAQHTALDADGPDAVADAFVPPDPARLGDYPVYAAHFANHAGALCAALLPAPMDDDAVFGFACKPLGEGLGLAPQEAAELMVRILLQTPHNTDGSEPDEAQIRALSEDELRWILIADIARTDAEFVLEAFRKGAETVDPSGRGIEALVALLGLPAAPTRDSPQS